MSAGYARPHTLADALDHRSRHAEATPVAGGTDLMVAINEGRRTPTAILDVSRVAELCDWSRDDDHVRIGAAVPLTRIVDEVAEALPGLVAAARLVGSPAIRHRATLGGNIATASPAGDTLLPLLAGDARIELASVRGPRLMTGDAFFVGPGRTVLEPDELITGVLLPLGGGQAFAKTGTRRAMVIAAAGAAVHIDPRRRRIGIALGAVAPTPRRASSAERIAEDELDWSGRHAPDRAWWTELGRHAAEDASPIDDVRDTAAHRRRAAAVMVARCARRAWTNCWNRPGSAPC